MRGILQEIPEPWSVVVDQSASRGLAGLTSPHQRYSAVHTYNSAVGHAHASCIVNSNADDWRVAISGLETLGAIQRTAILRDACTVFGPNGPPCETVTRHQQLAGFTRGQDQQFKVLDERSGRCTEYVNKRLMLYAVKHREHFVCDDT